MNCNQNNIALWNPQDIIKENDLVIMFENYNSITHLYVKKNEIFQNRHGAFHHNDIIGKRFGTKVFSRISSGWIYCLSPTPELWSQALPHRTQIVQSSDASLIIYNLKLKIGNIVIESGTGSGSLTSSFARTVGTNGHIYTFEFNQIRADQAINEFKKNELHSIVTVTCRDICVDGFGDALNNSVDAVFLDVPRPWLAIQYAKKSLKHNGNICSYSPCIEQVQKTCIELHRLGFENIRTLETRLITYNTRHIRHEIPDFDHPFKHTNDRKNEESNELYAQECLEARGHTAFLTFASKFNS